MSTGAPTVRSLDARVDDLEKEFRGFMAEMGLVVTLLKWLGAFSATTLLALIIALFSIFFSAGQLQQKVDYQATAMGKLEDRVGKVEDRVGKLEDKVGRVEGKLETQITVLLELKQTIQELRKEVSALPKKSP